MQHTRTLLGIGAVLIVALARHPSVADTGGVRQLQGGPTIVFNSFSNVATHNNDPPPVVETAEVTFDTPVTVIVDAKVDYDFPEPESRQVVRLAIFNPDAAPRGGPGEITLDLSDARAGPSVVTVGGVFIVQPGTYTFRVHATHPSISYGVASGWLRLQIWGCDPPGCIPGDLDIDGDVDLADFVIFAENFTG